MFFPAHSFKTLPEALKMIVLPTLSNNPHQQTVCGKINRLPAGDRPEITASQHLSFRLSVALI